MREIVDVVPVGYPSGYSSAVLIEWQLQILMHAGICLTLIFFGTMIAMFCDYMHMMVD